MHRWREPRVPGQGLYVRQADIGNAQLFRVHEQPGMELCTETVKDTVQEHELTNVAFLEVGETI